MQQIFEGPGRGIQVALYSPQHNEKNEINAFYAEMFSFFIYHGHLTTLSRIGSKCRSWQLVQ